MDQSTADAILIENSPRPGHQFNFGVVGRGWRHANLSDSPERCIIRLSLGRTVTGIGRGRLFENVCDVDCLVDTGTAVSIFNGSVAKQLGLRDIHPSTVRATRFSHASGGHAQGFFCEETVTVLNMGPTALPISVMFPCVPTQTTAGVGPAWRWKTDFPGANILGMRDILSWLMVCITREALFVFERSTGRTEAIEEANTIVEGLLPELRNRVTIDVPRLCRVGQGIDITVRVSLPRPLAELVSDRAREALPPDFKQRLFTVAIRSPKFDPKSFLGSILVPASAHEAISCFNLTPTEVGSHQIQVHLLLKADPFIQSRLDTIAEDFTQ